jgi:hypothetical protein
MRKRIESNPDTAPHADSTGPNRAARTAVMANAAASRWRSRRSAKSTPDGWRGRGEGPPGDSTSLITGPKG